MEHNSEVLFHAQFTFRRQNLLKQNLLILGLGCGLALLAFWLFVASIGNDKFKWLIGSSSILAVLALVTFAIGIAGFWGYLTGRVDHLILSTGGVSHGSERWAWENVRALRFVLSDETCKIPHVKLWTTQHKHWPRGGRVLAVDEHLTSDEEAKVIAAIRRFSQESGLNIVCD